MGTQVFAAFSGGNCQPSSGNSCEYVRFKPGRGCAAEAAENRGALLLRTRPAPPGWPSARGATEAWRFPLAFLVGWSCMIFARTFSRILPCAFCPEPSPPSPHTLSIDRSTKRAVPAQDFKTWVLASHNEGGWGRGSRLFFACVQEKDPKLFVLCELELRAGQHGFQVQGTSTAVFSIGIIYTMLTISNYDNAIVSHLKA